MLNSTLIGLFCMQVFSFGGAQGTAACSKAGEAATISLGVKVNLDGVETYIKKQARDYTPQPIAIVAPFVLMASQKTLKYQFAVPTYVDHVGVVARPGQTFLSLTWIF